MLLTHRSDEVDSEEGDVEGNGCHYGDEDEDGNELDCNDEENVSSNDSNNKIDFVVVALQKFTVDSLGPVLVQLGVS